MQTTKAGGSIRYYYIDFLRVVAILAMFVYHVFMVFDPATDFLVFNYEKSQILGEFNDWLKIFRMPLLFFVSGFISIVLFRKYSNGEFFKQRVLRLLIPFVLCTFIVAAPQVYYARQFQGVEFSSYWEFFLTFLELKRWPEGNFYWSHLWFIPYLFVYNLASIPIFAALRSLKNRTDFWDSRWFPLLAPLVAVIPLTIISVGYDFGGGLPHLIVRNLRYFPFVVLGLVFAVFPRGLAHITDDRRIYAQIAFVMSAIAFYISWNGYEPSTLLEDWRTHPLTYLTSGIYFMSAYMWVYVCLGYASRYFNQGSPILKYANQAVYPFYILHQTVIVAVAYHAVSLPETVGMKVVYITVLSFVATVGIYHLFIRPYNIIRFIFGLKGNRKKDHSRGTPEVKVPDNEKVRAQTPDPVI